MDARLTPHKKGDAIEIALRGMPPGMTLTAWYVEANEWYATFEAPRDSDEYATVQVTVTREAVISISAPAREDPKAKWTREQEERKALALHSQRGRRDLH